VAEPRIPGRAAWLAAIAIGATVLSGCASLPFSAGYTIESAEFGDQIPPEAEGFEPGVATHHAVLDGLGPPAAITALPDGFAFLYQGGRLANQSVGASVYSLRAGYSWSDAEKAAAVFVFDRAGRLVGGAVDRRADGTGRGFAVGTQRSEAADQLVFLLPSSQHFWGRQGLRRPPRTLMQQTNVDSGAHAVEQRGTTTRVGQRSLESGYVNALALLELLRQQTGN
jgi:hypothetical protein